MDFPAPCVFPRKWSNQLLCRWKKRCDFSPTWFIGIIIANWDWLTGWYWLIGIWWEHCPLDPSGNLSYKWDFSRFLMAERWDSPLAFALQDLLYLPESFSTSKILLKSSAAENGNLEFFQQTCSPISLENPSENRHRMEFLIGKYRFSQQLLHIYHMCTTIYPISIAQAWIPREKMSYDASTKNFIC